MIKNHRNRPAACRSAVAVVGLRGISRRFWRKTAVLDDSLLSRRFYYIYATKFFMNYQFKIGKKLVKD
jgi:hypothetical protein